jgi:hypothetical protein
MVERTAAMPRSSAAAAIGPADYFAEGVTIGPDGSMYLGSIRQRRVLRRHPDGRESDLTPAGSGLWAISGLAMAPDGRSLWLTSNAIPQMDGYTPALEGRAELVRVATEDGRVLDRIPVSAETGGAMLGDLVIAPDGGIYASDTRGQVIWHLAPGTTSARVIARHPLLRSPQGLVSAEDGHGLLVADYSHGLLRIDPTSGAVTPLAVPPGITVLGIDGLMRHGRDLIAIQNGGVVPRVLRIRLDDAERRVTAIEVIDRNVGVADEPTIGVVVGEELFYVANSQWEKRTEDGSPLPGAVLAPTVILRLPLGPASRRPN